MAITTKRKSQFYTEGANIDANYGPWDSKEDYESFITEDVGLDAPYDGTTIAVKDPETEVITKYIYEVKNSVGSWKPEFVEDNTKSYTVDGSQSLLIVTDDSDNEYVCSITPYTKPVLPTISCPGNNTDASRTATFDTTTSGAQVKYSINNGSTWTNGKSYTLTASNASETTTVNLQVKATKNGKDSDVASLSITVSRHLPHTTITATGSTEYSNTRAIQLANTNASEIRYTTDGSAPNESSTLYSAPFNITSSTPTTKIIKTIAMASGWQSTTSQQEFSIGTLKMYYGVTTNTIPTDSNVNSFVETNSSSISQKSFGTGLLTTYSQSGAEAKAWFAYDKNLPDLSHIIETASGYDRLGTSWNKLSISDTNCKYKVYAQTSTADNNGVTFKFS